MISVVIPVFNERATIEEILLRVQNVDVPKEIVIVDDASTDGTREFLTEVARRAEQGSGEMLLPKSREVLPVVNIRVFFQAQNRGKGAALRRGFEEARGETVIIQDADLEYDPTEYCRLVNPILDDKADVVFGSRFRSGSDACRVLYYWHSVGNNFLTMCSNIATDLNLTDMEVCYKAFRREVIQKTRIQENRFGFEPEVTAKVARAKVRIYEVGISYSGRTYAEGKKIGWRDGFRALWCIWKYNYVSK